MWTIKQPNFFSKLLRQKSQKIHDEILSILIGTSEKHYVLELDFTSMKDAAKNCHNPEIIGEALRMELSFLFTPEHVTEIQVFAEGMSSVAISYFGVVGKNK